VEGSCEHGKEPPGSIMCREVLKYVRGWRLLKKGSAPWSSSVRRETGYWLDGRGIEVRFPIGATCLFVLRTVDTDTVSCQMGTGATFHDG
jgi:hypothetical protein